MLLEIKRQERYSRAELLLRSVFGFLYIAIPHGLALMFVGIAAGVLQFLAFWSILFTGRYPESWFEFQVKYIRWNLRVSASLFNLVDGYPKFGLNAHHDSIQFEIPYPESISRSSVLLRFFFGWLYVMLPHGFILMLLAYAVLFVNFIAFWAILFTAEYPESMFEFQVRYLRWSQRVSCYISYLTHEYPPFSGSSDQQVTTT
ncbi:MAG: DUF4389 domain-containing protein [Flavobacteriales bacterium]